MNTDTASQALWRIAETDDTDEVESILAGGAEIDASNADGMTALMRAAAKGRVRMLRVLLDHGADPNRSRNDKFTPLMLAAFFGHQEIVRLLVQRGAETQAKTRFGTSAQMWAGRRTFKGVAQYLEHPDKIDKIGDRRLKADKPRAPISENEDRNLDIRASNIEVVSSVESNNEGVLVSRWSKFIDAVQPQPEQIWKEIALRRGFVSESQLLNKRVVVSVLACLLLAVAVLAGLSLQRKRPTEFTPQTETKLPVDRGIVFSTREPDRLPPPVVAKSPALPVAQVDQTSMSNAPNRVDQKKPDLPKLPAARRVASMDNLDSTEPSGNQTGPTKVARMPPESAAITQEVHSREPNPPADPTVKPEAAAVSRQPRPVRKSDPLPVELPVEMISPAWSSARTGKVIQWP